MKKFLGVIFAVTLLCSLQAHNYNTKEYPFLHFNTSNSDLSFNSINQSTILQDSRGFVWIGTQGGLNRYDGTKFRAFYKEELKTDSDIITAIFEDSQGNIWVGTQKGLTVYNYERNSFQRFTLTCPNGTNIHEKITCIRSDQKARIWLSVNKQGVFCYDPYTSSLQNYFVEDGKRSLPADIVTFTIDKDNNLYLSLYFMGLYYANPYSGDFTHLALSSDNVLKIIESRFGTYYLASRYNGINEYNPSNKELKSIISLNDEWVTDMCTDKDGRLWLTTSTGVMSYNTNSAEIININRRSTDGKDLSKGRPNSICVDAKGGIWVGTHSNGINYSKAFASNFKQFYRTRDGKSINAIASFSEDENGLVWVATMDNGLMIYNPKNATLEEYSNPLIPNTLLNVLYKEGNIWIGSQHGIFRLNLQSGDVKRYGRALQSSFYDNYRYVFLSKDQLLLIGTTLGLLKYDSQTDRLLRIDTFDGKFVTDLLIDNIGQLWLTTGADGIFRYSLAQEKIIAHYDSNNQDKDFPKGGIESIIQDSDNNILVTSSESGLLRYNPSKDCFEKFAQDYASSIRNSKIFEDKEGFLWLVSNLGLTRFSINNESMRFFSIKDGLINNEISDNSYICLSDGSVMVGSLDGFIHFHPRNLSSQELASDIYITDFFINNQVVTADDKESPLSSSINNVKRIVLKSHQNSFGFDISMPYAESQIECKLDDYDTQWQKPYTFPIHYSNIPSGKYQFMVRSKSDGGELNAVHSTIEIVVLPVFYKSIWAVIIYLLLIVAIVYFLYKRADFKAQKRRIEYENAKNKELLNDKVTFFAHIVHEIKTPLTLIRTPLQNIISSVKDEDIKDDLKIVNDSANYLTQLVAELLDYVRIERRGYVINCSSIDISEKLKSLVFNYYDLAKNKNISLQLNCSEDNIYVWADEQSLKKILNNLILNAVKYAESKIDISLSRSGNEAIMDISNDGTPIPASYKEEIFKPFVQYHSEHQSLSSGVGIGLNLARNLAEMQSGSLVLSDEEDITRFVLKLPIAEVEVSETNKIELNEDSNDSRSRLLLVDDNEELLSYMKSKLSVTYNIVVANNGKTALEILKNQYVNIIISDLSMPDMNGIELCKSIRSDIEISHIPIIVLSARSSVESKIMAMDAGATMYIEKPFDMAYLQACLRNLDEKRVLLSNAHRNGVSINNVRVYELPKPDEEMLTRLDEFILKNIDNEELSAKMIAEEFAVSESTLTRKMRSMLNTSPNNYIQSKRLSTAAQLLSTNSYRINEVCYAVGFSSPSYFTKCFKSFYGCLPKEYHETH